MLFSQDYATQQREVTKTNDQPPRGGILQVAALFHLW